MVNKLSQMMHRRFMPIMIIALVLLVVGYAFIPLKLLLPWEKSGQAHHFLLDHTKIPQELSGKKITLKKFNFSHFPDFHLAYSEVVQQALNVPVTKQYQESLIYLKNKLNRLHAGELMIYSIFDNKKNKLIGSIEICTYHPDQAGQLSCWLNEQYWGEGRMQEALKLISLAYFSLTQEDAYTAVVDATNSRALTSLTRFGFETVKAPHTTESSKEIFLQFHKNKLQEMN